MAATVHDISSKRIKKAGETPYPLDEKFALQVALLMCRSEKLWHSVGRFMEVNLIADIRVREIFRAVRTMMNEGVPIGSVVAVMQQVSQRLASGNLTQEQFDSIEEALEIAQVQLQKESLSEETAIAQLASAVRGIAQSNLVSEMVLFNGKGKSLEPVLAKLNDLDKIGVVVEPDEALELAEDLWAKFETLRSQERLRTGVPDLDAVLEGGPPPGSVMVWGADTKVGKSTAMLQQCAAAVMEGKRCLYIAMEMGSVLTMSRFMASLLGVTVKDISTGASNARIKLTKFLATHTVSNLVMRQLPPGSTPSDVNRVIEEVMPKLGKLDVIFIDYADRMSGGVRGESTIEAMKTVYNWMDRLAAKIGGWVVTASQLQRQEGCDPPGIGTLADAHWKARIAHLIVNIYKPEKENKTLRGFVVAGNRHGPSDDVIDGMQADFARMRVSACHYLAAPS